MDQNRLNKNLGLFDVFCIASGAMVSSGLFVLPGIAHALAGPAVIFSYFFAGLIAATGMLSVAEIITAMPKAGGDYFFITRTIGPAAGAVAGLLSWFSLSLKASFALLGMSAFLSPILGINPLLVSVPVAVIFIGINLIGVQHAGRLQTVLVIGLLFLMLLYVFFGSKSLNWEYFEPFAPYGWSSVFSTAGLVFVSYGGLLNVASVAEEIKNPGKVIPLGMIFSLIIIGIFYVAMVFITSGILGPEMLDNSMTPISDGARVFFGTWGGTIMGIAASLAFISTANAGMMAASRYLLALSRDELMPQFFGKVGTGNGIPYNAVIITGLFIAGSLFLENETLIKSASTVLILTYLLSNLCVIVLRESRLLNYRPMFHSPLYPWPQIAGICGFFVLLLEMGSEALLISLVLILGGLTFYWFYGRVKASREYALIHLMDRLMNKKLAEGGLEKELREIIRQRDELCSDPFEHVMKRALIIDIKEPMEKGSFWKMFEKRVAEAMKVQSSVINKGLGERELGQASEIMPGVAVTDLIVPGTEFFELAVVRCLPGLNLFPGKLPVEAFFMILTSFDKRESYLHTLAILAQIAGDFSFEHNWKKAKDAERLRDVMLLTERKRICMMPESLA